MAEEEIERERERALLIHSFIFLPLTWTLFEWSTQSCSANRNDGNDEKYNGQWSHDWCFSISCAVKWYRRRLCLLRRRSSNSTDKRTNHRSVLFIQPIQATSHRSSYLFRHSYHFLDSLDFSFVLLPWIYLYIWNHLRARTVSMTSLPLLLPSSSSSSMPCEIIDNNECDKTFVSVDVHRSIWSNQHSNKDKINNEDDEKSGRKRINHWKTIRTDHSRWMIQPPS